MNARPTLDYLAAKAAQKIVARAWEKGAPKKDIENLLTRALGVLQAQGVYALYLFLYSAAEDTNPASWALIYLWNILRDETVRLPLPENIQIYRIPENPNILFYDPPAVWRECQQKVQSEQKKQKGKRHPGKQKTQECERLINLIELIRDNQAFWGLKDNNKNFEHLINLVKRNRTSAHKNLINLMEKRASDLERFFKDLSPARDIILKGIRELTAYLDTLLLVRDLYEQTLIYARYHAKALGEGE